MDTNGFFGDTFSSGFGDFYTAKRSTKEAKLSKSPPQYNEEYLLYNPLQLPAAVLLQQRLKVFSCVLNAITY